jgi:serine/threonine-protein kinase
VQETLERLNTALTGRYTVERELGAGGMATVYVAHDARHDRRVALKVLRPELAAVIGAERFLAEIKTTANLQHPHILALFDSGQVNGTVFYVMPYVEGESLRDKLDRDKQLPIDDALRIAREVADALEYAHQHGVIHRDIKPENILVQGGHALVADFGIALAVANTGSSRMTETGMSLGTPTYMSPEQAMGERTLDARTDVYALGCVTYEMLTGEAPFSGPTAQSIVAKVLTEKPAGIIIHRGKVTPAVEYAVLTALEKLPADRFASAAEFSKALVADHAPATSAQPSASAPAAALPRQRRMTGALAGLSIVLGTVALWGWLRPKAEPPVLQLEVTLSDINPFDPPALSADGMHVTFETFDGTQLNIRDLAESTSVRATERGDFWTPFYSPDGKSIAYLTGFPGALKVLTPAGGQVRTVVPTLTYGNGGAWSGDGWIYYFSGARYGKQLMRVRAEGGSPELVAEPDSAGSERIFLYPSVLPGNRRILLTVSHFAGEASVGVLDTRTKTITPLAKGVAGFYVDPGYVVILGADGTIRAAKFDAGSGNARSEFVKIAAGADPNGELRAPFAVSRTGTMVYVERGGPSQVVRVTRDGKESPLVAGWKGYFSIPSLSPDASRLTLCVNAGGRTEIWIKSLPDGPFSRLFEGANLANRPSWTPDGKSVVFTSDHAGEIVAYRVPADGSQPPARIVVADRSTDEVIVSHDGQWVVYRLGSGTARHLYAMHIGVDTIGHPLLPDSRAQEYSPTLSPDGRWLAYASDESGRDEVYIRPFPNATSAKYAISRKGGNEPMWSHSGRELFFRQPDSTFAAADIAPGSVPTVTAIRTLFGANSYAADTRHVGYTVMPDDQSFLFVKQPLNTAPRVHVTMNLARLLREKIGK